MILFNKKAEMRAIKSICESKDTIRSTILGMVEIDYFYYDPCIEAYKRIVRVVRDTGEIPDYHEICGDPLISESHRQSLIESKAKFARNKKQTNGLIKTLTDFRKLRILFFNAEDTIAALQEGSVDIDKLIEANSNNITQSRLDSSVEDQIFHIGAKNNTGGIVKEILYGDALPYVPTGFKEFDDRSEGIFYGSLLTLAATTGGGKSTFALQLLKNMAELGNDVAIVPLEMSAQDTTSRYLSNLAGIDLTTIMSRKLSSNECKKVKRLYRRAVKALQKADARFTIFDPKQDMTIEEILFVLKPYNHRVILIDYISLLKGTDGDNSWQKLGEVARFCKVWAKNNDMVVILLAQLADTGDIRYAKSIIEHSSNAWTWVYTEECKESKILDIRQIKSRNQNPFSFKLAHDFKYMTVRDPTEEEKSIIDTAQGNALRDEMDGYLDDLSEED